MTAPGGKRRHTWAQRFRWAGRGVCRAVRSEANFKIHLPVGAGVLLLAALLRVGPTGWCLLVLCIATVLAAELFNTAIEHLARAITRDPDDEIRRALDTSAGAVLVSSIGAAIVGALVLGYRLAAILWS